MNVWVVVGLSDTDARDINHLKVNTEYLVMDVWVVVGLSNTDARDINHLEVNRVSCSECMGSSRSVRH